MGSTKEVSQFLALLALSVIIQPEECHAASVNISAPETFIGSLFDEFGSNKSMNSQQFNSLLKELNIGSSSKEQISENGNSKVRARKLFHSVFMIIIQANTESYLLICLSSSPVS